VCARDHSQGRQLAIVRVLNTHQWSIRKTEDWALELRAIVEHLCASNVRPSTTHAIDANTPNHAVPLTERPLMAKLARRRSTFVFVLSTRAERARSLFGGALRLSRRAIFAKRKADRVRKLANLAILALDLTSFTCGVGVSPNGAKSGTLRVRN
jgi:hypothetical protein